MSEKEHNFTYPNRKTKKKKKGLHGAANRVAQWDTLPFDLWTVIINMLAEERYDPVGICALRKTCRTLRSYVSENARARKVCDLYEKLYRSVWIKTPKEGPEGCYKVRMSNIKPISAPGSASSSCTWVALMLPSSINYRMVLPDFAGFVKSAVLHEGVLYTLAVLYESERQGINLITFCFRSGSCHRMWPRALVPRDASSLGVTLAGDVVITCRDGQTWHCKPKAL